MHAGDTNEDAATLALRALVWTLAEPDRALRLLSVTGIAPHALRESVGDPAVLAAALGFLEAHEPDLIECAGQLGVEPATLVAAREKAGGMRPLLISDCDEVLLHMVKHFGTWVGEAHDIDFAPNGGDFSTAMKRRGGGDAPTREEMWGMLGQFFPAEMHRQTLVPHAAEALVRLSQDADIVILTNLADECRQPRIDQLAAFGIRHRVECNSGGKGGPVAKLVAEYGNPVTVFVDDLAVHHDSVARHAPGVHRLHMISEPELAPHVAPAPAAHARIDDWRDAADWISARFAAGVPATEEQTA